MLQCDRCVWPLLLFCTFLETLAISPLPHKQFVYLLQASTLPRKRALRPNSQRDVIWLTFKDMSGDIHFLNSTYSQGRNRLLDEAISRAVRMPEGGYLYYIFMDGDIKVEVRKHSGFHYRPRLPSNPFDCFETFLREWEPAVGSVAYQWTSKQRGGVSVFQNMDALLQAQHRETLSFGLPGMDLDCHSSYYQQHVMNSLNTMLYNTRRVQLNAVLATNTEHNNKKTYKRDKNWNDARCFAKNALRPNSSLHGAFVQRPLPTYTTGRGRRRGNVSYLVPSEVLHDHFDVHHPLVARSLEFRARADVQQLLRAAAMVPRTPFELDPRGCAPAAKEPDHRCFRGPCSPTVLLRCPSSWQGLTPGPHPMAPATRSTEDPVLLAPAEIGAEDHAYLATDSRTPEDFADKSTKEVAEVVDGAGTEPKPS
eukprot:EG_transcript_10356